MTFKISTDGINFSPIADVSPVFLNNGTQIEFKFPPAIARFVKVFLMNKGKIPDGNPGAGEKAWLFVSEIQVN